MTAGNINGRNLAQIVSKLRRKGADIECAAKLALREGVEEIVVTAKMNCPVKTGALRDSIHPIEENEGASYKIVADAENSKGEQYGKIVEFSPKINRPFLYPAIDAEKGNINARIAAKVRQNI